MPNLQEPNNIESRSWHALGRELNSIEHMRNDNNEIQPRLTPVVEFGAYCMGVWVPIPLAFANQHIPFHVQEMCCSNHDIDFLFWILLNMWSLLLKKNTRNHFKNLLFRNLLEMTLRYILLKCFIWKKNVVRYFNLCDVYFVVHYNCQSNLVICDRLKWVTYYCKYRSI
jgi:hypothetical protein